MKNYTNKVLLAYHQAKYILAESSDGDSELGKLWRKRFPVEYFEALRFLVEELEDAGIQLIDTQAN